jgi:hypothetical protein
MSDIVYRPRSIPEIIDASIQLFRRSYRELIAITAIGYVPWIAASTLLTRLSATRGTADVDSFLATPVWLVLAGTVWFAVVSAGCIAAASDAYLGKEPQIASALRRALRRAWPIVAASLVTWVLAGLGLILLIIPGLYVFARFALSPTIALLEQRSTGESLARASSLSRDRKLHIIGALGAALLIYLVVAATVGLVIGLTGQMALAPVAEAIVTIGISPLIAVVSAVLYYDLRIRAEGFDVELLERQLQTGPEPT